MADLDDLFSAATTVNTTADTETYLTISHDFRKIDIPKNKKLAGVTNDELVNRILFKCDRYYGGNDLSEFTIRINYKNANGEGDQFLVTEKTVSEDAIIFAWIVGRHACEYPGTIQFIVCAIKSSGEGVVEQEYNTYIHELTVKQGLETTEEVYEKSIDLVVQLQQDVEFVHEMASHNEDAEAYAVGKRGGKDVSQDDAAYHNNAKYYSGISSGKADESSDSATQAAEEADNSEAWAVGKRNGIDVESTDEAYQNNAKYYSDQAKQTETSVKTMMLTGMTIIQDMTATSATIAPEAETRYIYGELNELTVNSWPSIGIVDISFESGATPTVMTLPASTIMLNPSNLEANRLYELSVEDNKAVLVSWPRT